MLEVLNRPRLARHLDFELRTEVLDLLLARAIRFEPGEAVADCRDPTDNKYLELALAANARTIVASDHDLLVLHPWRGIQIVRPADYLSL